MVLENKRLTQENTQSASVIEELQNEMREVGGVYGLKELQTSLTDLR